MLLSFRGPWGISMRRRDHGRVVMSGLIGRDLSSDELVHHKDGNHFNHTPNNLELTDRAGHIRIHKPCLGYKFTDDQRNRLSESHKGQKAWNKGKTGFKHSQEARINMSRVQKGRKITWGYKISEAKTKVRIEDIISILKHDPEVSLKAMMLELGIKTHGPILKLGGLRKLRKEYVP
jgi:hypothetical protein